MFDNRSLKSPRLHVLQQALGTGDEEALQTFWRVITDQGAPIIEGIEGDETHSLVTFLWRSNEISSVAIISLLTDLTTYPMTRMLETDLWYMTCRVRNDVRATYQFSPVDPANPIKEGDSPWANWRPDPFNPTSFAFYTEEEDPTGVRLERSILTMPDARKQPWIAARDGVPTGQVKLHYLESSILNNERRIWAYTPPAYNPEHEKAYPLIILFDGWGYRNLIPTPTILDNLLSTDRIPPIVAVFLDSLSIETRMRELIYHDPFNDFLIKELLPWIHKNFHVSSYPEEIILGSSSAGGLAAAYAGLKHSETFGNVLSQSGAFRLKPAEEEDFGWFSRQFAEIEKLPLRFHIDVGLLEENSLRDLGDGPSLLQSTRQFRDVLQGKNYDLHYTEVSGGHDYISWQGTLSEALQKLLARPTD